MTAAALDIRPALCPHAARKDVIVDPALADIIHDPGAPVGVPTGAVVRGIPGETGTWAAIRGVFGSLRRGVAYSADHRARYGDIYQASFAGMPVVLVWDADEIHKILRNDDRAWSTALGWDKLMFHALEPHAGNARVLLTLDFDDHRAARKLVQPAFTMKALDGYRSIAARRIDEVIPTWIERGKIGFKREVRIVLANVASAIFTGIDDPDQIASVDRALVDFWGGLTALSRRPWLSPTFRRSRRGLASLLATFRALVPVRRATGGDDLLSQLCRAGDDDEAIVRTFLSVMFGAFDTTSAAITSMGYLLAKHPEWQERVRDEARQIPLGELDLAAMKKLPQLESVWKETLRLMPVASFVPRCALREVEVSGHVLPAGTFVGPMMGAIGRHPRWWKDPERFDPDRFSSGEAEQHPGIALPFGGGAHACVGQQLALMEMKLFWHALLHRCRFSLAPDYDARHTHTPMGCVSGKVELQLTNG
jgi:cytochrome P450